MSTVTYKNQPAIERTKGRVPLAGTSHLYRVSYADALNADVHQLSLQCLEKGNLAIRDADRFRQAITELASIYGQHIRIDVSVACPKAKRALSDSQKSDIACEMASTRRSVS